MLFPVLAKNIAASIAPTQAAQMRSCDPAKAMLARRQRNDDGVQKAPTNSHGDRLKQLLLASSNPGKLAELSALLRPTGIEVISQSAFNIGDVEETASTFVENALLKARHAARTSGLPTLADDSGLCVDALNGAPGLHSARYAGRHGDSAANIEKLLGALDGFDDAARGAYFICVLVLLRSADDPAPLIAEGRWHGRILHAARGTNGFGYDPVFFDSESHVSAAELCPTEKHARSHRGIALRTLMSKLS